MERTTFDVKVVDTDNKGNYKLLTGVTSIMSLENHHCVICHDEGTEIVNLDLWNVKTL